jgi:hypothetical protein
VDIRLHFAERFWTSPGQRVQDISAEGNVLVNNFDIFASAGAVNRAYVMSLNDVGVADGALNLSFKADIDYPSIAGIEVLCRAGC